MTDVATLIVSSGQISGKIQQFDWDGESLSEGMVVGDIGDSQQLMRPLLFPFSMAEECGLTQISSDTVGAFTQIDDKWGEEGGWLKRIATSFFRYSVTELTVCRVQFLTTGRRLLTFVKEMERKWISTSELPHQLTTEIWVGSLLLNLERSMENITFSEVSERIMLSTP